MLRTPSTASDDSDTCDREEDVLYIEITLRRAISGQQLGHAKVLNMSRLRNRLMSLGSLMAMGRAHEEDSKTYQYILLRNLRRGEEKHRLRLARE